MPHDELSFHLLHGVHGHSHHDQERRSTKIEIHVQPVQNPCRQVGVEPPGAHPARQVVQAKPRQHEFRNERDQGQIEATHPGDFRQDIIQVVGGALARPDSRHEPTLLFDVIGNLVRVVDNRKVEVGKENNHYNVRQRVKRLPIGKLLGKPGKAGADDNG